MTFSYFIDILYSKSIFNLIQSMVKFYFPFFFIAFLLITSNITAQNVGIGVPSPSEKLEVAGNVYAQRLLVKSNSVSTTSDLSFTANAHIETDNSMTFSIDANNAGNVEYFGFGMNSASRGGSFSELMRIEEGGNVGIGTTNPTFKLDVAGTGRYTGQVSIPLLPILDEHAASKKYVDDRVAAGDDWNNSGDDIYNNNAGGVGINVTNPVEQLEVNGQVVRVRSDGRIISALSPYVPVPSIKTASDLGWSVNGSNDYDPNLAGESDPCSGLVDYAAAVAYAESYGARLPTIEEAESQVATGTGCGYDSEYIWTQTKCGPNAYFVTPGNPSYLTTSLPRECRVATDQAYVRMVAEVDKGNLPAITDGDGALRTDKIKARIGNGIQIVDDNDNSGITLLDGGDLRFDQYNNGFLQVDGSGNVSTVSVIPSGSITEVDPTWSGTANTSSSINRSGKVELTGGSTASSFPNANVALEIDYATSDAAAIQINGSTAPYRIALQDGHGRVHHYWNAYDNGSDHRYDVSSETATWMEFGAGAGFQFRTAPGGTAGDIISWNFGLEVNENGKVGVGGSANGSYELYVNGKIGSNGINETSDERFKKDIRPLENAMDKVRQLNGVSYYWRVDEFPERKFDDQQDLGLIAQDIEKVLPQVVNTDIDGYKSVQYSHIVPLLIEALKEQDQRLMERDVLIKHQEEKLASLDAKLVKIENYLIKLGYTNEVFCSNK